MLVIVVGPCGSGKSTLAAHLQELGYDARIVAQEHSRVHDLWRHGGRPDALIYLDASPTVITRRRGGTFPRWLYDKQIDRLNDARAHTTLYLHTDASSPQDVLRAVTEHLRQKGFAPQRAQK